jgi:hypothetical protein
VKTFRHTRPTTFTGLGGLLGLLLLLLFVQPALAAESCTAPPGTSGLDQYCEALPGAGGTNSHHHGGGGGGGSNKAKLPQSTTKALQTHGAAGAAILALTKSGGVSTSAPTKPAKRVHHRAHHKGAATPQAPVAQNTVDPGPPAPPAPSNNPASAVGSALGVGSGLLWALLGVGLVFALLAWLIRRRGGEDRPAPQNI